MTPPSHGTITITNPSTGAYSYTPGANFFGADSFTFKVNDGDQDSNTETITITVNDVNDPPVASDGTLAVNKETIGPGTLVASDTEGALLTFSIVTPPAHGTVTITDYNTGTYTYEPQAGFTGSDSFTFKVNDGMNDSNTSTVTITVLQPLYFCVNNNGNWATIANWYNDLACTEPANRLPVTGDSVVIVNGVFTDTPTIVLSSLTGPLSTDGYSESASITVTNLLSVTGGKWYGTTDAGATITFSGTSINHGTIAGHAKFYDSSSNWDDGTVGSAEFSGLSLNFGTVIGNAVFYQNSENHGTVSGDAVFNDDTKNFDAVLGNAIFNNQSTNSNGSCTSTSAGDPCGLVVGNATFNDSSNNTSTGVVNGTVTWGARNPNAALAVPGDIYFCPQGDQQWATQANWYRESDCTTLANRKPADGDRVFVLGSTFTDQAPTILLHTFYGNLPASGGSESAYISISDGGALIVSDGFWYGTTSSESSTEVVFSNSSRNYGTVNGNATFNGSSSNGAYLGGDATFNDNSSNDSYYYEGILPGNYTFNGSSFMYGGEILGAVAFNDSSKLSPVFDIVFSGSVIFNNSETFDYSFYEFNGSNVIFNNSVTFNGSSYTNPFGVYNGSVDFPNGATITITNTRDWVHDSSSWTGLINWIFEGTSKNLGTVRGTATFNGSAYNIGTVDGDAVFNNESKNGDESSAGIVTGNATFNDLSINTSTGVVFGILINNTTNVTVTLAVVDLVFSDERWLIGATGTCTGSETGLITISISSSVTDFTASGTTTCSGGNYAALITNAENFADCSPSNPNAGNGCTFQATATVTGTDNSSHIDILPALVW